MSAIAAQRARFAATAMTTATPQALLVMLYDRLVLDLQRAEHAQRGVDLAAANAQLQHAQDIVTALSDALDVDAWDGGPGLASLYAWLGTELVQANVTRDADRTAACRALVEPLRDAWREVVSGGGTPGPARDGVQVLA
ncbi:flagellar export chaperone FliS [Quadrisphaera sp. DSM 44207]|uniref:flagellar export chaperone FliS n=1 Tax=Quadrisphaera sp. DSM 44207 TaxID=1881057 RepID=UPI000889EEB0|nr:flagellar export chaperone FliS [Quadrisphaera sp. DSM 44207]SDQ20249.1 flagellar protein FliS [Quadrisphaera sp. DSM 44207]